MTRAAALLGTAALALACVSCGSSTQPKIKEFDLPDKGGSTHEITLGPDGNVWVSQQNQNMLVRISPQGALRFFGLPDGGGPHGIRFDRTGHLWMTLQFRDEIAELDQNGVVLHAYRIPYADAGPHGLAIAADGTVWWTGKTAGVIGRVDPRTGQMRVFRLPDPTSQPIYIEQGCDGMYFTELNAARIGRITSAGTITEYPTPSPGSRPIAVAARSCQVWFSEEHGGHFGVLDSRTGKITEYASPKPDQKLAGLGFDAAGTLWLAYLSPDAIGRVGANMAVQQFPLPTKQAVLHRIILGPGGNMWFTELAVDKVGYITGHQ